MGLRLFSTADRPVHLGPYPLERLVRAEHADLSGLPPFHPVEMRRPDRPHFIGNAMAEYQAMMDAIRDGLVNRAVADVPADPAERARHLKAFGYFSDASMVGVCRLPGQAGLTEPVRNPEIDRLAQALRTRQTKTLASGIDMIMADLKESMEAPPSGIEGHTHALVFLYEYPRDPDRAEPGVAWIEGAQRARACLRASETAVVLANYLRLLGYRARAHTGTSTDVHLGALAVAAGLAVVRDGRLQTPFTGDRFGLAAVTTDFEIAPDRPLAPDAAPPGGLRWWFGRGCEKSALNGDAYRTRRYVDGPHPFERLHRVDTPTTYMDEPRIPRVPKRTDTFARAQATWGPPCRRAPGAGTTPARPRRAWPSAGRSAPSCCCRTVSREASAPGWTQPMPPT